MKEFNWCFQRVGLYSRIELYSCQYGIRQEGGGNYFKWSESLCPKFSHLVTRYNASRRRGGEAASWLKCHQATAYVASSLAAAAEATTDFLFAPLSVCVCVPIQNSTTAGCFTHKWTFSTMYFRVRLAITD